MNNYFSNTPSQKNTATKDFIFIIIIAVATILLTFHFRIHDNLERWLNQFSFWGKGDLNEVSIILSVLSIAFGVFSFRRWKELVIRVNEDGNVQRKLTLLAQTFVAAQDSIVITDLHNKILMVNNAFLNLYGYSEEELLGTTIDIVRAKTPAFDSRKKETQSTSEGTWHGEIVNKRKNGTEFPIELWSTFLYDDYGIPVAKIGVGRDITERKKALEMLQHSEDMYRNLVSTLPDAITQTDMEGSITFISDRTMQLFGHSSDTEILGNNILKWVAPEDHAKAIENLRALIEKNYVKDAEYRLVKHNGTQFWGEINSAVIRGTDGSSKGMIFVTRDVTERKHGENLLRLSEQRYKLLAESSLTGVYLIQNNVFRYVNPSFAEIFGYEVAEIINILGPMDLTSPEHRSLVDQQIQKRLYGTENDIRYTFKGFRKNKTEVDVEVHGGKTIFEGEPAILGTLLDITDRKQIENQLRNLSRAVEQSPVSIIITDPAGNIEYVNPKFIQVSGYTFEEVLGKNPRFLKSDHTPAQEYKQLWETISAGGEWRGEFHNKKKNGELYWESVLISGIRDNDKNISHFLAVKEDITEKKLLEAQMLRAQRMESIGTLAGGIAHDLNNVLAPILMAIEILRKQVTTDAGQKILKTLETSAERGKNIIRQVLTFARGIDGERTPLQPKYLMKEIEQIIKETFPKMIEIQLEIQNGLYDINGDLTQLHQVLMNLCVNARDAMPYGGKLFLRAENVTIDECYAKLRNQNTSGLFVLLSISDTGTGIPANILNKIFDPFFTTKEIGKGTGLGLSTVHTIVKNHGGFVDVHSEEGKGTMFKVYLPATESTMNAQQQKEIDILQQGRGEIILIVDDELAIREITKQTLESNGYNAYTAADGTEALVLYSKIGSRINVVVTDIMMPFLDGWSTIRALRMLNPDIKIIAMSGLEVKEQMSGAIGKEILGFLSKPFNAKNLLTAINDVLRHPPVFHLER